MKSKDFIWVTFQKEGIHKYPAALTEPKLSDVSFLGYPHRHIFHFRVSISVNHDDRDIEYYGIHTKQEEKYVYQVMLDEDTPQGEPLDWSHAAETVVKVMGDLYPNMTVKRETIVGDVDHVILPTERRLVFGDPLARSLKHTLPSNHEIIFDYGSGIGMTVSVWFHNYNQTFDLDFSIEYVTKSVIRNTDIEEVLTEIPKFAMGFIQARVE